MKTAAALCALMLAAPAFADGLREEATGIAFDASPTLDGIKLSCLATGLRKKFVVKVYAAAFCLDADKAQATLQAAAGKAGGKVDEDSKAFFDALREAPVAKAVDLRFVHDAPKEKMVDAFNETLDKAVGKGKDPEGRAKFLALVDRDIAKGDRMTLTTTADGKLTLTIAGHAGSVTDPAIARGIWEAWIGPDSVTPGIKEGLAKAAH